MSERFYYGPFVVCVPRDVEREVKTRSCPNEDCSLHLVETHPPDSYCPRCGTAIDRVLVKLREVEPQPLVVSEAIRERLFCAEVFINGNGRKTHCWLPNVKWSPVNRAEAGPEIAVEIVPADIGHDLVAFEEFFRPELEMLLKFYGVGGRRLIWGHVFYFI